MKVILLRFYFIIWLLTLGLSPSSAAAFFYQTDQAAVSRGKMVFMNYCAGCHSLRYLQGTPFYSSLPSEDALKWFGVVPPDLSLTVSQHGTQWLEDYLTGFYPDSTRPFGTNNRLVPNVAMPNVFEMYLLRSESRGHPFNRKMDQPFDLLLDDLILFLTDVATPERDFRHAVGAFILIFLFIFLMVAHKLKRLYW